VYVIIMCSSAKLFENVSLQLFYCILYKGTMTSVSPSCSGHGH